MRNRKEQIGGKRWGGLSFGCLGFRFSRVDIGNIGNNVESKMVVFEREYQIINEILTIFLTICVIVRSSRFFSQDKFQDEFVTACRIQKKNRITDVQ